MTGTVVDMADWQPDRRQKLLILFALTLLSWALVVLAVLGVVGLLR